MKVSDRQKHEHMESVNGGGKPQSARNKSKVSHRISEARESDHASGGDELSSAKVRLSSRAQDMKKIRAAVDSAPDADEAKIAKFKSMIAKGEYNVDPKAVADKMVDEHAYNDFFTGSEE